MKKPNLRIVITGGAGGIARSVSDILAERIEGHVALFDIDEAGLDEAAAQIGSDGLEVSTYALDLRDDAKLREAMDDFGKRRGGLDILFANAGVMTANEPFEVAGSEAIARSVDLNFRCVATSTAAAWPWLEKSGGQVIVNASQAGLHPLPSDIIYCASKAAAVMFARANAMRAKESGIRFNAVCPGVVETPILNALGSDEWRDEVHVFTRHFELLKPADIAEPVYELMIDRERNGEVIEIANPRRNS